MCIHPIRLHTIRCGWVWLGCGWGVVVPNTMSASSYLHSPNKAAHNKVWLGCVVGVVGPNTMSASSYLHSPNKAARNGVWLGCVAGVWLGQIQCQHPVTCIHTIMLHAMGCVVGVCCWCVAGVWLGCGWGVAGPNTMSASSYLHSPNLAAHNKVWLGCVVGV